MILNARLAAAIDGAFVVFVIGLRINKPWPVHKWLPVAWRVARMRLRYPGSDGQTCPA